MSAEQQQIAHQISEKIDALPLHDNTKEVIEEPNTQSEFLKETLNKLENKHLKDSIDDESKNKLLNLLAIKLISLCYDDNHSSLDKSNDLDDFKKVLRLIPVEYKYRVSLLALKALANQQAVNMDSPAIAANSSASSSQSNSIERWIKAIAKMQSLTGKIRPSMTPKINDQTAIDLWCYFIEKYDGEFDAPFSVFFGKFLGKKNNTFIDFIKNYILNPKNNIAEIFEKLGSEIESHVFIWILDVFDKKQRLEIFKKVNIIQQLDIIDVRSFKSDSGNEFITHIKVNDLDRSSMESLLEDTFKKLLKYKLTYQPSYKDIIEKAKQLGLSNNFREWVRTIDQVIGHEHFDIDESLIKNTDQSESDEIKIEHSRLIALELSALFDISSFSPKTISNIKNHFLKNYIEDKKAELLLDISLPDNKPIVFSHLKYITDTANFFHNFKMVDIHGCIALKKLLFMPEINLQHLEMMAKNNPDIINFYPYAQQLMIKSKNAFESNNIDDLKIFLDIISMLTQKSYDEIGIHIEHLTSKYLEFLITNDGLDLKTALAYLRKLKSKIHDDNRSDAIDDCLMVKAHKSIESAYNTTSYLETIYDSLLAVDLMDENENKISYIEKLLTPISDESQQQLLNKLIDDLLSNTIETNDYASFQTILMTLMSKHPQTTINKLNAVVSEDKIKTLLEFFIRSQNGNISSDLLKEFNEGLLKLSLDYFMGKNDEENSNQILSLFPREISLFKQIAELHYFKISYLGMLEILGDLLEENLSIKNKQNFEWLLSRLPALFSQKKFVESLSLSNESSSQDSNKKLTVIKNILRLAFTNFLSPETNKERDDFSHLMKLVRYSNIISFNLDSDVGSQFVHYYLDIVNTEMASALSGAEQIYLIQTMIMPIVSSSILGSVEKATFINGYFDLLEKHNLFNFTLEQFFNSRNKSTKDEFVFYFLSSTQFLRYLRKLSLDERLSFINQLMKHRPIEKVTMALCETEGGKDFLTDILASEQKTHKAMFSDHDIPLEIILSLVGRYPKLTFNSSLLKQLNDKVQSSNFNIDTVKALKIIYQLAANGQQGEAFNELANYFLQKLLAQETFAFNDIKMFLRKIPQLTLTEDNKKLLSDKINEYVQDPETTFHLRYLSVFYLKHGLYLSKQAFQSLKSKLDPSYTGFSDLVFYNYLVEKFGIDALKLQSNDETAFFSLAIHSDNPDEIKYFADRIKFLFQIFSTEQQEFFIKILTRENPNTHNNLIHQMVIEGNLVLLSTVLQIDWRMTDHREPYPLKCNLLGKSLLNPDSAITPLAMAIMYNAINDGNSSYVDIARALLTYQKNTLNFVLSDGLTALQLAAKLGDLAMVKMLLAHENNTDKNATLNFRFRLGTERNNEREYTALDFAIDNGHVEVVKSLIENGCDYLSQRRHVTGPNNNVTVTYSYPIERAAKHPEMFAYFLTLEGIDIHKKFPTVAHDAENANEHETLLKHCIDSDNFSGIEQLLDSGVDINERVYLESKVSENHADQIDDLYGSYLIYAIKQRKLESVKLLLSYYPNVNDGVYKNDDFYKSIHAYMDELWQAQDTPENHQHLVTLFDAIVSALIQSNHVATIQQLKSSTNSYCEKLESETSMGEFSDDDLNRMTEFSSSVKSKNAYAFVGEQELHAIHQQSIAAHLTNITQELSLRKNSFEAFFTEENCQLLAGLIIRNDDRAITFFNEVLSLSGRCEDDELAEGTKPSLAISEQCAGKLERIKQVAEEGHMNIADVDSQKVEEFCAQLFEQHINLINLLDDKELPLHVMIQIECESSAPDVNNLKALVDKLLHETKTSQSRINWQALKQKLIHLQATWPMRGGANQVQGHEALTAIINRVDEHMVMKAARMRMRDINNELYAFFAQRKKTAEPFKKEPMQPEASPCDEIDESRLAACSY